MQIDKPNVLFLECGSSGHGGSFKSLKEHIEIIRDHIGIVVIVLVNESIFKDAYEKMGCVVLTVKHPIYTNSSQLFSLYNNLFSLCHRISKKMTLCFQIFFERRFIKCVSKIITEYHINLLYLNNQPMRNFSGFVVAKKTQVAVVAHIRTLNTYGFSNVFSDYIQSINPKYIAISMAVQNKWSQFGIKSRVVYNPVPICNSTTQHDKKYDLIYVGRLVDGKGISCLISAVATLSSEQKLKLAIVGDGPLMARLKIQVVALKLDKYIDILGYQPNPLDYISRAKILILPSENEGLGRVLIEAMKLRVAVIANNTGGIAEIIDDGVTGILYSSDEQGALVKSIRTLVMSDELRLRYITAAYKQAMARFSPDTYRDAINAAINEENIL